MYKPHIEPIPAENGDKLINLIYAGIVYSDCGAECFRGKEWEICEVTEDGDLIHIETKEPVPPLAVGTFSIANHFPDRYHHKPVRFTGRKMWSYAGRGYAHEVEIDMGNSNYEMHVISCDGEERSKS